MVLINNAAAAFRRAFISRETNRGRARCRVCGRPIRPGEKTVEVEGGVAHADHPSDSSGTPPESESAR